MSKKSTGVIYKSDIVYLYKKISDIENTYQKTITDWLNELTLIFSNEYFNALNHQEKLFFNENIRILIDGKKNLNYKTAVFFIPLLLTYDNYFIKNTLHKNYSTNSIFIEWFYEIIGWFDKLGIELTKENYIIQEKYKQEIKISNNKKYSESKKSELIRKLRKSKDEKLSLFFKEMNECCEISLRMYAKLDKTISVDINKKCLDLINEISYLPLSSRHLVTEKLDNIVKKEIEKLKTNYEKYKNKDSYEKYLDEIFDYLEYKTSKEIGIKSKKFEYDPLSEYSFFKQMEINE
ncbi:Uncharacterised protein [[Clostridium] sordellii]|uniref:hypothetical protein n=1 Tax=Paraclostridium sordellii TaxID=1505 RepID=UPI0005E0BA52|nr:hypothetical protein [Paeniclostridium sordellii]CEQ08324.1 Uncharacterised protein [[Clostridium] sordellii] [Paeniclostridium sordellii]